MSKATKHKLAGGMVFTVVLTLIGISLFANPFWSTGASPAEVREIVLEARDLAFDGDNPTLLAEPGERVRLVVRNNDPGILHSISLPGIDSEVRHIKWGEEIAFEITIPDGGTWEYVCPQHMPKMKGRIEVVQR